MIDPALGVALVGLVSAMGAAAIALRSKKIEVGSVDLAGVRATIVAENESLRRDNRDLRSEVVALDANISSLRSEIRELTLDLDQTRRDLALERRRRRAGDAGLAAEHKSADAGQNRQQSRQAGRDARDTAALAEDDDDQ